MSISSKFILVLLCCFVATCFAKHTLHVDTILPSATNSVLLRDVQSEVFAANSLDLQFITLDLKGESSFVVNTSGEMSFDGSFVGFDAREIYVSGGANGYVNTPDTISLSGNSLDVDALRFILDTDGDMFINTDGSIVGTATRVALDSLAHVDIRVAQGPLEFLASDDLEITARSVELVGDDRISLYSFDMLNVDTVNDFQAYAAFIDFDSFGDIRLTTETGNIHMGSIRDIILESNDIFISAPIGIDFQSEHGEIRMNMADDLLLSSADIVYVETFDELRFAAENDFEISANDLVMTTGEEIKFHAKTLEVVFNTGVLESHSTRINTGGDINFDLNSNQGDSYFFEGTHSVSFESRNIVGESNSLSFATKNSGSIEFAAENERDSFLTMDSNSLVINAASEIITESASFESSSQSLSFNVGSFSLLSETGVEDSLEISAGNNIILDNASLDADGENTRFIAGDEFSVTSGIIQFASGDAQNDEEIYFFINDNLSFLSGNQFTQRSALGSSLFESDDFSVDSSFGNSVSFSSAGDMVMFSQKDMSLDASVIQWNLDDASFDSNTLNVVSSSDPISFSASELYFWVNQQGEFSADSQIEVQADGDANFKAFHMIRIEDLQNIVGNSLISFEGTENVNFIAESGMNFINDEDLLLRANSFHTLSFVGEATSFQADTSVRVLSGFVTMRAENDAFLSASDVSFSSSLEENINFISESGDISWNFLTGMNFANSDDNLLFEFDSVQVDSLGDLSFTFAETIDILAYDLFSLTTAGLLTMSSSRDITIDAMFDIDIDATSSTFNFNREFRVRSEGELELTSFDSISYNAGESFEIRQNPLPGSVSDISLSGNNEIISLSGSFTQNGGSTFFGISGDFLQESSQRILVDSADSSSFLINGDIDFDASSPSSSIRLESVDFLGFSSSFITLDGDYVSISSSNAEYIDFRSTSGNVMVTSSDESPISWNAAENWDVDALAGLVATSNDMINGVGMLFTSTDDVMSEMEFFTRNDDIYVTSLDSQTFTANFISLAAQSDLLYTNFFPPLEVGGVQFTNAGSAHDGIYEDQTGISVRSHYPMGNIDFPVPFGNASFNAGEDLLHKVDDGRAFFTSKVDITFMALQGDFDIDNLQGDVIFQSNISNVTFTSNGDSELQAYQSIHTLAGKDIRLISLEEIDPTHANSLSFEFVAFEGNIDTRAVVQQPIFFEGNNFTLSSNEDTFFTASDNIPIQTNTGGFLVDANTGIYLQVDGGDLDMTASDSIFISSSKNSNLNIISGDDMVYSAENGDSSFTQGKDTVIQSDSEDILFLTRDPSGDIRVVSEGEIRFQADGTDDNFGASQVDGIFVDAPQIQSFSADDSFFDAGRLWTVGANTRPIISLEAGGDALESGVVFTSEGNINQEIGANFQLSVQGTVLMETLRDEDFTATGEIVITSKGTQLLGRNLEFQTEQKMDIRANDIEINGNNRIAIESDEFLSINSRSLLTIDVLSSLHTTVDDIFDINGGDWLWTCTDSFFLLTEEQLAFSNNGAGSISIYGDTSLFFDSDINSKFVTESDNADITIQTENTNSELLVSTLDPLSPILFQTGENFSVSSVDETLFNTEGQIQITSPLNSLYSEVDSNISLTSAQDISFIGKGNALFQAHDSLSISATATSGADLDISVQGNMFIQAWQDASFFTQDTLSFSTSYNITFLTEHSNLGDITLSASRDIEQDIDENVFVSSGGDFILQASTFEMLMSGDISFLSTDFEGDFIFLVPNGDFFLAAEDDVTFSARNTAFLSLGTALVLADGDITLSSSGLHNEISFLGDEVLLTSADDISFFAGLNPALGSATPSLRNGHGFVVFGALGASPLGFGTQMNLGGAINIDVTEGSLNLLSFGDTSSLSINAQEISVVSVDRNSEDSNSLTISSPGVEASISFNTTENEWQVASFLTFQMEAISDIEILPFDDLTFLSRGSSASSDYAGILLQSNHPSADVFIFTTDFLTADVIFDTGNNFEIYSQDSTTFLLLDDDDAASIGTYQVGAGSINVAAENNLTIQETATGDIFFEDPSGELLFTAGNDINLVARELLEFDAGNIDMEVSGDFLLQTPTDIQGSSVFFDLSSSFTVDVDGLMVLNSADRIDIQSGSRTEFIVFDDIPRNDGNINQQIFVFAEDQLDFDAPTVRITLPRNRIVDFRDGLVIPTFRRNSSTGDSCTGRNRSLFFDRNSNQICYCDSTSLQCLVTSSLYDFY